MNDTHFVIYFMAYIFAIIYLVVLGGIMLWNRGYPLGTRGEQMAKRRLTRTMGVAMFLYAFETFIYLPPMLMGYDMEHPVYKLIFLVVLMLNIPMVYNMMIAVVQRRENTLIRSCALGLPYFVLGTWQLVAPPDPSDNSLIYVGAVFGIASFLYLFLRHTGEYQNYMSRIESEYSEITHRDILWSMACFAGLTIQGIIFVGYQLIWTPLLDVLYLIVSFPTAAFLCYCTYHQRTIDLDAVDDDVSDDDNDDDNENKPSFNADTQKKLKTLCEEKLLFLNPDLTREMLCRHTGINPAELSIYFRHYGFTYYQYINTLRIEYAFKLIQENPDMPASEVCKQSGFRSTTAFRREFQEAMGCLPSEMKRKKKQISQQ